MGVSTPTEWLGKVKSLPGLPRNPQVSLEGCLGTCQPNRVPAVDGFILAASVLALGISVLAVTRSVPAKLLARCDSAEAAYVTLRSEWSSVHETMLNTLQAVTDERERAMKSHARARSERQRVEGPQNGPPANETRTQKLDRLRASAGILSGV